MHSLLKQNTAATVTVGPVLNADGTAYVTNNLTYADFLVSKNGTWAAMVSTATIAHVTSDVQGNFKVTFTGSGTPNDVDTIGRIEVSLNKATLAAPIYRGTVLVAATFDALITNAAGGASGLPLFGSAMGITAGAIVTASFGTCVLPAGSIVTATFGTCIMPETTKTAFLPSATAGAAGGLFIAGSNAATTFASLTVTGNVSFGGTWIVTGAVTLPVAGSGTGNTLAAAINRMTERYPAK